MCTQCGHPLDERRRRRAARFCSRQCTDLYRRTEQLTARSLNHHGYIVGKVWRGSRKVTVLEHRWVMEQHIGRRLLPEERIHHINGDRTDYRVENLLLYPSQRAHWLAEHADRPRVGRVAVPAARP